MSSKLDALERFFKICCKPSVRIKKNYRNILHIFLVRLCVGDDVVSVCLSVPLITEEAPPLDLDMHSSSLYHVLIDREAHRHPTSHRFPHNHTCSVYGNVTVGRWRHSVLYLYKRGYGVDGISSPTRRFHPPQKRTKYGKEFLNNACD